ncbi:unnamed protein product [Orchesella dallaii]|uniref:Uncharacterized protein n=1 Tax=Orchesella dallaii TaxID=48710 RepID=A0ABP1Q8L5_9HEXA
MLRTMLERLIQYLILWGCTASITKVKSVQAITSISHPSKIQRNSKLFSIISSGFDCHCSTTLLLPNSKQKVIIEITSVDLILPFCLTTSYIIYNNFEVYDFRVSGVLSDNVTSNLGYWRFSLKNIKNGVAFFIFKSVTFTESLELMDRSGYGNNDHAVFYLINPKNDVPSGFESYLYKGTKLLPEIMAAVVFLTLPLMNINDHFISVIAIYCHFCPEEQKFLFIPIPTNSTSAPITHSEILLIHKRNNGNGHGHPIYHMTIHAQAYQVYQKPECQIKNTISLRVYSFLACDTKIIMSDIGRILNMTVVGVPYYDPVKTLEFSLLRTMKIGLVRSIINPNISTQVTVSFTPLVGDRTFSLLHCVPALKATLIKYDNYFTAFDIPTWISILGMLILYIYITKSFWHGVDLICFLINATAQLPHKPILCWAFLLGITMISNIYESILATDFYRYVDLENLQDLLENGYKIRVSNELILNRTLDSTFMLDKYRAFYSRYKKSFYTTGQSPIYTGVKLSKFLENMVKNKTMVMVNNFEARSLPLLDGKVKLIDDKFCSLFPYHAIPFRLGIYTWSFLSLRSRDRISRLRDHGILLRYEEFAVWVTKLIMKEKGKLYASKWALVVLDPKVFGFSDSIRFICGFQIGVLLTILGGFLLIHGYNFLKRCIHESIVVVVRFCHFV